MPLIEVHLIENVFNPEQKRQIIKKLTDTMVTIDIDVRNSAIPTSTMMLRLDNLLVGAATRGGY